MKREKNNVMKHMILVLVVLLMVSCKNHKEDVYVSKISFGVISNQASWSEIDDFIKDNRLADTLKYSFDKRKALKIVINDLKARGENVTEFYVYSIFHHDSIMSITIRHLDDYVHDLNTKKYNDEHYINIVICGSISGKEQQFYINIKNDSILSSRNLM